MIMLVSSPAFYILHRLQNRDVPFARIPGKNDFLIRAGHIAGNIREGDKQYGERVAEANESRGLVGDDRVELGAETMAIEESLVLPGLLVETVARQEPALLLNIIFILSQRLKDSMNPIESLSLKEIPGRLASFLLHDPSKENAGTSRIELTITQRELAKILGATPEALSRALRKLAEEGILATSGRSITILDRKRLAGLAEGEV